MPLIKSSSIFTISLGLCTQRDFIQQLSHPGLNFCKAHRAKPLVTPKNEIYRFFLPLRVKIDTKGLPQASPDSIAAYRLFALTHKGYAQRTILSIQKKKLDKTSPLPLTPLKDFGKIAPPGKTLHDAHHTVRRFRPFFLLRCKTSRPLLVFILARKPCVLFIRTLCG